MRKEKADVVHVGVYVEHNRSRSEQKVYMQDTQGRILAGTLKNEHGILHFGEFLYNLINNLVIR